MSRDKRYWENLAEVKHAGIINVFQGESVRTFDEQGNVEHDDGHHEASQAEVEMALREAYKTGVADALDTLRSRFDKGLVLTDTIEPALKKLVEDV